MDTLQKALSQFGDAVRALSPRARVAAAALAAVVLIALVYLTGGGKLGSSDTFLLQGQSFSNSDLNAMQAALGKAGLAEFEVDRQNRIRIPQGQQDAYLAALADAKALPTNFADMFISAVGDQSLFADRKTREDMGRAAMQKGLSLIIQNMNAVDHADVVLDFEKAQGFRAKVMKTALVNIRLKDNEPMSPDRAADFQQTVAAAVAGMTAADVTVADAVTGRTFTGANGSSNSDAYLAAEKRYLDAYEQRIRQALNYVPGVGVAVHVELTKELSHQVLRVHADSNSTSAGENAANGAGGPTIPGEGIHPARLDGAVANQGRHLEILAGELGITDRRGPQGDSGQSHARTTVERAPLVPTKVTVSISVPSSYFERVLRERKAASQRGNQPSDLLTLATVERDEIAHIKAHITPLLPTPQGIDPEMLVTVTSFVPPPASHGPVALTEARPVADWLSANRQMLSLFVLVAVAIVALRALGISFRAQRNFDKPGQRLASKPPVATRVVDAASDSPPAPKRPFGRTTAEREELAAMVRDNPERASTVLQSWMSTASRDR